MYLHHFGKDLEPKKKVSGILAHVFPRAYFAYGITSRMTISHVLDVISYEVCGLGTNAYEN